MRTRNTTLFITAVRLPGLPQPFPGLAAFAEQIALHPLDLMDLERDFADFQSGAGPEVFYIVWPPMDQNDEELAQDLAIEGIKPAGLPDLLRLAQVAMDSSFFQPDPQSSEVFSVYAEDTSRELEAGFCLMFRHQVRRIRRSHEVHPWVGNIPHLARPSSGLLCRGAN